MATPRAFVATAGTSSSPLNGATKLRLLRRRSGDRGHDAENRHEAERHAQRAT